ncbi:chromogranin-A [Heteronotia binoei]|uniref:chromogranin-A n=1 Tax=Heteronotia binoei TaxID=13085 RepID=UPI00292E3E03|nr:chromogranin-A [Heteronotia binoei]
MTRTVFLAVLLLAGQVMSLPVMNPTAKDDTKVMKCIVEVISDTVSKPNPLPISQECLEILQGDERIRSILRHQNLLKELQDIAIQGASERTEQQKKNSGFEDELSEVLESQSNKNTERDLPEGVPNEEPTTSFAELEKERSPVDNERDVSKEDGSNSLEERETRAREADPVEEKEMESNEVGETEELPWDDAVDNHIRDDLVGDGIHEQGHPEGEEPAGREEADEFEEKERISKNSQEESHEEVEDTIQDPAEDEEGDEEVEEEEEEEERGNSEEERATNSEDEDEQKEIENEGAKDDKPLEEREKYRSMKGGRHHSLEETTQAEEPSRLRDTGSEETGEEASKDLEDAKRWNKMDELAKQLTTTKRTEENEGDEDPDRSMKVAFRARKYDFRNSEDETRSPQAHHSKEDASEGGFPLVPLPEEKKDEEGSANRRTEEQELESLAAIEAELEKVAQKLHALRRG